MEVINCAISQNNTLTRTEKYAVHTEMKITKRRCYILGTLLMVNAVFNTFLPVLTEDEKFVFPTLYPGYLVA